MQFCDYELKFIYLPPPTAQAVNQNSLVLTRTGQYENNCIYVYPYVCMLGHHQCLRIKHGCSVWFQLAFIRETTPTQTN
jgi:hypothetical protein